MTNIMPHITYDQNFQKMRKKRKRLVVVNRTRFIIVSLFFLIIMSIIISSVTSSFISEASTVIEEVSYTVAEGDTLWSIAKEYNYFDHDIREVVYDIKKLNHIESNIIEVGNQILIPVASNN